MLEAVSLFFLPHSYKLLFCFANHSVAFSSRRVQLYLSFREFEGWLFVYKVLACKIFKVSFILSYFETGKSTIPNCLRWPKCLLCLKKNKTQASKKKNLQVSIDQLEGKKSVNLKSGRHFLLISVLS